MRRIAHALTGRFVHRNIPSLFKEILDGLTELERSFAETYWNRMLSEGHMDRFNEKEWMAQREAERYIGLDTVRHTDAREVGAEWLCKQTIDKLGIKDFLLREGYRRTTSVVRSPNSSCVPYIPRPNWPHTAS